MSHYIQYHNCDKRGMEYLFSHDGHCSISTRLPHVKSAEGTVFLIVGVGKPRQYFLWETFEIEEVSDDGDGGYVAHGPGWQLCPPQRLEGDDFDAFKDSCANFVGFRQVDDLPYSATLKKLATKHRAKNSIKPFLQELRSILKEGTDDFRFVHKLLGDKPSASKPVKKPALPNPKKEASTETARKAMTIKPSKPSAGHEQKGDGDKTLRALSIRQPHAEAIMRGIKKIEYRSILTRIRGRVQIYASLGRYSAAEEAEMLEEYGMGDATCDSLPRGVLIGTVEISDCTEDYGEFSWHLEKPKRAPRLLKPKKQPQPVWFNPF